ncbi:hypothetical protein [Helicobacter cetorum]|uniref:RGS domain-containing GTPase-activating protein n=1 Tax=Helicobacter cetorum (strain ATCC BAA-429 / MIT 00-7128) TaxID=182217 RepID=I0EMG3_HELC0|nr:hypothetical protein [Helicobacter cetorum]AFI04132.1 hypothetical protein HCW_04315 [Helicobacter cetorum MIT 00-7128]
MFNVLKCFLALMLGLSFFITQANALVIITDKEINLNKTKEGILKGYLIFEHKVLPIKTIGSYKLDSRQKNVAFNVSKIIKDDQTYTLSSVASAIKEIKNNKRLRKGSKLILAGENQQEIAQILGISLEAYQQKGSGGVGNRRATSSSSGGTSGAYGGSAYGGVGGTSGSGASGGANAGVGGYSNNSFNDNSSGLGSGSMGSGGVYGGGTIGGMGNGMYPMPLPYGEGGGSGTNDNPLASNNSPTTWSNEFCKAPVYTGENEISLSIVEKNGSCQEMMALRNDTACSYSYNYEKMVAIKQTQFYFVNADNQSKNIGGCVNLRGAQYEFPMYYNSSECKLQVVKDLGYGMGVSEQFMAQIQFRGEDGMIHTALGCTEYANVVNQIIGYENNNKTHTSTPLVDQYYINPKTGKKVYLNRGVTNPLLTSQYQQFGCGPWEYDDEHLQARRRTILKSLNKLTGQYEDVTGCNFNAGIKQGAIVEPYIEEPTMTKVLSNTNTKGSFSLQASYIGSTTDSHKVCGTWSCWYKYWTAYSQNTYYANWQSTYQTTITQYTTKYQRPLQIGATENTYYVITKTITVVDRNPIITSNSLNLSDDFMASVEAQQGYYKDSTFLNSAPYVQFMANNYKPNEGTCLSYSIWSGSASSHGHAYTTTNSNYACNGNGNYIIPQPN